MPIIRNWDYPTYGSPMPMRRNLVQCSFVFDTTVTQDYSLNDTFNGAGNTGSFTGTVGTTVSNSGGYELSASSNTVYPVITSVISTVSGREYIVSADLNGATSSPGYTTTVLCEVIEGGVTVASQTASVPSNFSFTYVAGGGSATVRYTYVLTLNPGPPPPPPMAPYSFNLDNALVYYLDSNISSNTVCVSRNGYRYVFNGMENDNSSNFSSYYTEFRQYDSRLSIWLSIDPLIVKYPYLSPYISFNNNPNYFNDVNGLEGKPVKKQIKIVLGSLDYYENRAKDYENRNPGRNAPSYYRNYGSKYIKIFTYETKPKLSSQGKEWLEKAKLNLQLAIEQKLKIDPNIENNDKAFTDFCFASHVKAYVSAGLLTLPVLDKVYIFLSVEPSDLFSASGQKQAVAIFKLQMDYYSKNTWFAFCQMLDAAANIDKIMDAVWEYYNKHKKYFESRNMTYMQFVGFVMKFNM